MTVFNYFCGYCRLQSDPSAPLLYIRDHFILREVKKGDVIMHKGRNYIVVIPEVLY